MKAHFLPNVEQVECNTMEVFPNITCSEHIVFANKDKTEE